MKKFIIYWDAGYGRSHMVIDADDSVDAQEYACEELKREAETNGDYGVLEWSEEAEKELI